MTLEPKRFPIVPTPDTPVSTNSQDLAGLLMAGPLDVGKAVIVARWRAACPEVLCKISARYLHVQQVMCQCASQLHTDRPAETAARKRAKEER